MRYHLRARVLYVLTNAHLSIIIVLIALTCVAVVAIVCVRAIDGQVAKCQFDLCPS